MSLIFFDCVLFAVWLSCYFVDLATLLSASKDGEKKDSAKKQEVSHPFYLDGHITELVHPPDILHDWQGHRGEVALPEEGGVVVHQVNLLDASAAAAAPLPPPPPPRCLCSPSSSFMETSMNGGGREMEGRAGGGGDGEDDITEEEGAQPDQSFSSSLTTNTSLYLLEIPTSPSPLLLLCRAQVGLFQLSKMWQPWKYRKKRS